MDRQSTNQYKTWLFQLEEREPIATCQSNMDQGFAMRMENT